MKLPIQLLSTDFDGTFHADNETPPVPLELQQLIAALQSRGMAWVINTGRDLSSLMETLGRAQLSIWPDYVVAVEREIYCRDETQYVPLEEWNTACTLAHEQLFAQVRLDVPRLTEWIKARFDATIYADPFSPFCLIARNNPDAELIHAYLEDYCAGIAKLAVVRNDVYARFCHSDYNKGSALGKIAARLQITPERIVAAGDHLNDLPMLSQRYARWLIAPGNAVPAVQQAVRAQKGRVSEGWHGHGVLEGLKRVLNGEMVDELS